MSKRFFVLLAAATLALPPAVPRPVAAQTGSIEGRVELQKRAPRRTASRYAGSAPTARLTQQVPAVAFIKGRVAGSSAPAADHPMLAQQDTAFAPPLIVVPVGASVEFPNRDPFFHNVFSYSSAKRFDLGRYPRGESKTVVFDEPGVVKVYCEVHESMRSAVVVVENPFNAVLDADGSFRIDGVPPGSYTLVVWDADGGEKEVPVTVRAGAATPVRVAY